MSEQPIVIEREREFGERSEARIKLAAGLPSGAHVHISGVCGSGTGAVLQLLKALNFYVTGSDRAFYPPMGGLVRELADKLYEGYDPANLAGPPALVVIGNSLTMDNPEVQHVLESGLPFASMPEVIAALLIGDRSHCRTSIVVTGTHGKTTTTAACAWILEYAKRKPGFFIGGVPFNLPAGVRPVNMDIPVERRAAVLEGDEYDSACFAKFSKFHCYRPDIAIVTSLEFDHADIYRSIEEIEAQFDAFAARLPAGGLLLVSDASERLDALADKWRTESPARVMRYGEREGSEFRLLERRPWSYRELPTGRYGQEFDVSMQGHRLTLKTRLTGSYNACNLLACAAAARELGVGDGQLVEAVQRFEGVKRRQEVLCETGGVTVLEDFAHHPTAVKATLEGVRESWRPKRLVAAFDPRSNTSRRSYFQEQYAEAFSPADLVVIREVVDPGNYSATDEIVPLDMDRLIRDIRSKGTPAEAFREVVDLQNYLLRELRSGDVALLMSNGSFEGLPQSLPEALKKRPTSP